MFDDKRSWQYQRGDFGVTMGTRSAPNAAIDWFGPTGIARVKIATDQDIINSCVEGCGVHGNHTPFAVT